MPAEFLKRTLTWSIPTALMFLAIQYFSYGKLSAYAVAVSLIVFLIAGMAWVAVDSWWKRRFGASTFASRASTVFWAVSAICLFVFFYRMQ